MIIKRYKYKNRVIGYVESSWDDNVGTMYYAAYIKFRSIEECLVDSYDEKECLEYADNYLTKYINDCKESDRKCREFNRILKKYQKKYQSLYAKYTDNDTKPLSDFDRDLLDRIMGEYAFRLG